MTTRSLHTDFLGTYVVYTFDDGHTETVPAGRPVSREDLQRLRVQEMSKSAPAEVLSTPDFSPIRVYEEALFRMNKLAVTSTASPGAVQALLKTVSLGGAVPGDPRPKANEVRIE